MSEYRFVIDIFTPETLPMQRLSAYMAELAKLLGEPEHVHFVEVAKGSAVLVASIEESAFPKVRARISSVRQGKGDPDALKAEKRLDDLLAEDGAVGQLIDHRGAEIIAFPGCTRPKPLRFGPFREDGLLEGVVIRVGGKDDSVPVWLRLRDGTDIYKCTAPLELARKIAVFYPTGQFIRVRGLGRWMREADGSWSMDHFDIREFEVLDETPLPDIIKRLQAVPGAAWGHDPIADLKRLRRGESLN